jgi:hypothetical protein
MDALGHILTAHLPYPAVVVDRLGDIVSANTALTLLFEGCADWLLAPPVNAYRVALHPEGMAPRIVNFAEWARHVLNALEAELTRGPARPDDKLAALHEELTGYVPPYRLAPGHLGFAVPLQLRAGDGLLSLITTITSFATAADVTISELRLEAFLPADEPTAAALRDRAKLGA